MKRNFILIILLGLTLGSAAQQDSASKQALLINSLEELKLLNTLWQQNAAEYRALCYQAFNTAKLRLDEIPKKTFRKTKVAIITDLDETILDNSWQQAQQIKDNQPWNTTVWKKWTDLSAATAVPGAVELLQYAKQKGASIFYISNRSVHEVASTVTNLKKLNLPDADTSHCLFLSTTSSKELRRQTVMTQYNVVMLMGDNLADFAKAFEGGSISNRFAATDSVKNAWGDKFIVLPNATYGEWESALYRAGKATTPQEKLNLLRSLLKDESAVQQ